MPQSLSNVLIHLIFSTKNRAARLQDKALRKSLFSYMTTVLNNNDSPAIIVNGTEDHVHILCVLSRKLSIAKLVEEVKTEPSKWMKKQGVQYHDFHWQSGYGVFSVSPSMRGAVRKYIENQEEHHRTQTFQDEFREICLKHGVEIDERYVWN